MTVHWKWTNSLYWQRVDQMIDAIDAGQAKAKAKAAKS